MRVRPDRILSGWRARRLVEGGGLLVRDGAAFHLHQRTDERSTRCGRVPAHVVARLKRSPGLAAHRGDPDRLVRVAMPAATWLAPLSVPADLMRERHRRVKSVLEQAVRSAPNGVRLRAAATRFRADYALAASPGRLRSDAPQALAAARDRLVALEATLGTETVELVELLVLHRIAEAALKHVTGLEPADVPEVLTRLAGAYGLAVSDRAESDQEAGRAFASA